ncbi:transglutaminase domain-containing protein [Hahella ganghwensis]|uniref:transglutaminase domain-containing protein n=1 Tax=Hahella ganghwensis TaxID=286420 RepID=UPI0003644021|nr:transglutaminase domain-containing protein [Hahella ganghwensis]
MTGLAKEMQAEAVRVLDKLATVDNCHRVFNTSTEEARTYGLTDDLLAGLVLLGLNHQIRNDSRYFDSDDLYNLSLYLKLPSIHKMAMRSWVGAFKAGAEGRQLSMTYSIRDDLSFPANCSVMTYDRGAVEMSLAQPENIYHHKIQVQPVTCSFPEPVVNLLEELSVGFEFYMLHDAIRWETSFMKDQKIGECGGFSKMIVERARHLNIEARHVFGILASQPYGTGHYWAEFLIEGQWLPADPLMILLLRQHARLPADEWPLSRSPGGALLPLSVVETYDDSGAPVLAQSAVKKFFKYPVVTHGSEGLPVSISLIS